MQELTFRECASDNETLVLMENGCMKSAEMKIEVKFEIK